MFIIDSAAHTYSESVAVDTLFRAAQESTPSCTAVQIVPGRS